MERFKLTVRDASRYRILYIIVLFFNNVSFIQLPAYSALFVMFFWGLYLVYYKIVREECFDRMRFSVWVLAFLATNFLTMLINISVGLVYNLIMMAHISNCFFVFYGIHTEKDLNTKGELYKICKFIIYVTTILGVLGFACLMSGIRFKIGWTNFIIFENRYTGLYTNPNILGFISVVSIVCCHIISKHGFLVQAKRGRISRIWLAVCLSVNLISLLLCDSNASFVLFICYVIFTLVFYYFSMSARMPLKQAMIKLLALTIAAAYVVGASFMVRIICQRTISSLQSSPQTVTEEIYDAPGGGEMKESFITAQPSESETVTFKHKNKNLDSGRIKLLQESIRLFWMSPVFGISNGNIIEYSQKYQNGTFTMSYHNNDIHNGYMTILVSTGIMGFLFFAVFGLRLGKHIIFNLFKRQNAASEDILPCLFAFCCSYLVYSLFEKALLYDISFMVIWFWYMIGMSSVYLNKYEPLVGAHYNLRRHKIPRHMI